MTEPMTAEQLATIESAWQNGTGAEWAVPSLLAELDRLRTQTDLEVVEAMLTRAGIGYHKDQVIPKPHQLRPDPGGTSILAGHFYADDGPRQPHQVGYSGFYADLRFGADGALIAVGAWE